MYINVLNRYFSDILIEDPEQDSKEPKIRAVEDNRAGNSTIEEGAEIIKKLNK